ncbi:MAG TPA: helix-turn-helix transcriptional regulator [Thermoanaerobaculia bacterium]|jgi:transcriptional regulator with XRE-family HTH domain
MLKAQIPPVRRITPAKWYPEHPETLGEHLWKARMERGVSREGAAQVLGVGITTLWSWEMGRTNVATRFLPKVLVFLGYDPRGEAGTLGGRIRMLRERQGITQQALAERLGLDDSTVTEWELDRVRRPFPKVQRRFEEFLAEG